MSGTLYICGTPIGNLEDISLRCLRILKEVAVIAAEDTRHTIKLLNYYEIKTPLTSYHEHNKQMKGVKIVDMLLAGKNVALVSDAGMPAVSDPGEDLVSLCYAHHIEVTTVPGPTAVISALVLSGLSVRSYRFEGFLPASKKQRGEIIKSFTKETSTVVLYEAPHHIKILLDDLYAVLGDRNISLVRELTKKHEQVHRGTLSEMKQHFEENEPKGEFVVVIEGYDKDQLVEDKQKAWDAMSIQAHMDLYQTKGHSEKDAMKLVAKDRGVSKREIYAEININSGKHSARKNDM